MTKTYRIALDEYDLDGMHLRTGQLFSDLIAEFETDYHRTMRPLRANALKGNARMLLLLESCFLKETDETFGMDLIDGELNMDVNLRIDAHGQRTMVYAIGSGLEGNEDEPLFLVRDDRLSDRVVELGLLSDGDDEDPEDETPPNGTGEEWEKEHPRKPWTAEELNRPLPTPEEVQAFLDHLCACGIVDEWMLREGLHSNTRTKTPMDFNKAMERKRALIPESGYNVVGIDPFEMPDEALYRIAHTDTLAEAERIAEEKRKEGIRVFIYDKDTE